jgi:hypothetical protein
MPPAAEIRTSDGRGVWLTPTLTVIVASHDVLGADNPAALVAASSAPA